MTQQIKDRSPLPEGGRKVVPTESPLRLGEGKDRRRRRRKKQSGSTGQDSKSLTGVTSDAVPRHAAYRQECDVVGRRKSTGRPLTASCCPRLRGVVGS